MTIMVSLLVRRVMQKDLPGIYRVEQGSFRHPYPPYLIDSLFDKNRQAFFVAEVGDRVVGYAIAEVETPGNGHVISVAVSSDMRGRGIGEALMGRLIEELKGIGVSRIRLEVEKNNVIAQRMYRRLGFVVTHIIRDYYEADGDALVMTLSLE